MATSVIAFPVNLRRNKNQYNAAYGKYYAEPDAREPLNLRGFAKHISDHGKLLTYDLAQLALRNIVDCMKELITQGQPVKLDGLGTFFPTIETDGSKAKNSVEATMEQGIDTIIAGVHLRFTPEGVKGDKLTSRSLKDECVFQAAYVVESIKKMIDGKTVTYQEKTPISSYAKANAEGEIVTGTGSSGSGSQNQGGSSEGGSGSQSGSQTQSVAAPTISGETPFAESTSVSIQAEQGAEIRYTTDGSTPTAESSLYSTAFTLSDTATVKAIAIKDGQSSQMVSKTFTKSSDDDQPDNN